MAEPTFQTVQLKRGGHLSPDHGACVMELASMLAGEPFTDHPRSVCPVIASFLRGYNDALSDADRCELYPYAAMVVGSAVQPWARRRRAEYLVEWARPGRPSRRLRLFARLGRWNWITPSAVRAAVRMEPDRRPAAVTGLLESLLRIGASAEPLATLEAPRSGGRSPAPTPII